MRIRFFYLGTGELGTANRRDPEMKDVLCNGKKIPVRCSLFPVPPYLLGMNHAVPFILTDIEGTTSSISFVAEELFPYFREHIRELLPMKDQPVVAQAFAETVSLAASEDGQTIVTDEEII